MQYRLSHYTIPFVAVLTGERVFPPQSGLTLSTWFCMDKFSNAGSDGHPVRLLTVVRNIQGRDENLICLSVFLTSRDRALIVTTQESYMPVSGQWCGLSQLWFKSVVWIVRSVV